MKCLKKAEQALRASEERLRTSQEWLAAILGSAMDAIITLDADQRILVFNAAAEKVFGCAATEAIGHPLDRFIPSRFREVHGGHIQHFGSAGTTSRSMHSPGTFYGLRANGEEFPVDATISQVAIGGEKLYTVILRDITQRKQAEASLIRSEKLAATGRLAATIAHEINNPLEAMSNLVYLLGRSITDASTREYVDLMEKQIQTISRITTQTLKFHRENGRPAEFALSALVAELLQFYEPMTKKNGVTVAMRLDSEARVFGFSGEIRQVLSNLLLNALEATPQGGRVMVHVYEATDWRNTARRNCLVSISDTGMGIDSQHRSRIFEPFFTTKGEDGTGLGLWVSMGIVNRAGGCIRVRSTQRPGSSGTCFSILLPTKASLPENCGRRRYETTPPTEPASVEATETKNRCQSVEGPKVCFADRRIRQAPTN